MLKKIIVLITFIPLTLSAQAGKVYDNLSMKSEVLKGERKYAIYLPPDYETSERSYPVLYLLHGYGDDQAGWIQFGEVLHIADKAIKEGKATPMIIVMPNADVPYRGYVNRPETDYRYEDFFINEFIPYIEKTYRIRSQKRYRAIAGLSMGGEGTFIYALHHPELFSSACPLSAATGPSNADSLNNYYILRGIENLSKEKALEFYNNYNVVNLINNLPAGQLKSVRWYIDCGDDDFLTIMNSEVHIAMTKKGIPHEFRMRDGAHNWTYWRESLPNVLKFVSDAFHQY
ncbi:putative esterase [Melioribacter roseus P3M-2]|uniref:Putative esterase n=1 Tax=Melioribacter roseus (strain DSM 23840 / JCM 17771 / VKM B-2668 / P3M-2) TaxID=1191523 RepID=I6YUQ0_MELRP|nr:alpha/beta hydrolase-fold protein [Melioribacter roseus]AFN74292.1 putative esterase [Melioribacter roseus P3M-2]